VIGKFYGVFQDWSIPRLESQSADSEVLVQIFFWKEQWTLKRRKNPQGEKQSIRFSSPAQPGRRAEREVPFRFVKSTRAVHVLTPSIHEVLSKEILSFLTTFIVIRKHVISQGHGPQAQCLSRQGYRSRKYWHPLPRRACDSWHTIIARGWRSKEYRWSLGSD